MTSLRVGESHTLRYQLEQEPVVEVANLTKRERVEDRVIEIGSLSRNSGKRNLNQPADPGISRLLP